MQRDHQVRISSFQLEEAAEFNWHQSLVSFLSPRLLVVHWHLAETCVGGLCQQKTSSRGKFPHVQSFSPFPSISQNNLQNFLAHHFLECHIFVLGANLHLSSFPITQCLGEVITTVVLNNQNLCHEPPLNAIYDLQWTKYLFEPIVTSVSLHCCHLGTQPSLTILLSEGIPWSLSRKSVPVLFLFLFCKSCFFAIMCTTSFDLLTLCNVYP